MAVVVEASKPLAELVDLRYARNKRHGPAKRLLDSLVWASENLLLCVERGEGGTVTVRPELAQTAPPTMAALTFLQAWAGLPPGKLAETITRLTMRVSEKLDGKGKGSGGVVRGKGGEDGDGGGLSAEAQAKVNALNRRIEQAKAARAAKKEGV